MASRSRPVDNHFSVQENKKNGCQINYIYRNHIGLKGRTKCTCFFIFSISSDNIGSLFIPTTRNIFNSRL